MRNRLLKYSLFTLLLLALNAVWYFHVPAHLEYRTYAPSQFLDLHDTQVHYLEEQDDHLQPTLLLVHGFASSTYTWYKLWPLLAPHYHLIAIDLPGFGLSEKRTNIPYTLDAQSARLIEFIEKKRLPPLDVIAWSMGGLISMYSSTKAPQHFKKIVAITPALDPDIVYFPRSWAENLAPLLAPWLVTPLYIKFTFLFVFRKPMTSAERELFANQAYYPYHNHPNTFLTLISHLKVLTDIKNPSALQHVPVPFEILAAKHDRIVKTNHYNKFLKLVPDAKIIWNNESGHGMMIDDPQWVYEKATSFFEAK